MKIYNSFTKQAEGFKPLNDSSISIYACGITPQNHAHLGHAVAALRFSVIRRYLTHLGYKVNFVENITDIDDKIIARSKELNMTPRQVAEKFSAEYRRDLGRMGVPAPDKSPRVTEYIDEIITYIQELMDSGYAYAGSDGNVYFDVSKHKDYGELSGRRLDDELTGVRVDLEKDKKHAADFALWKSDKTEGASWLSPWGTGRPGWHIECSVMSNDLLGNTIDIHCGGLDLLFPHHENEKAQCEAHNSTQFVNYWVHCGLLNVDGAKMSKSLGNFMTISDGLEKYGRELIVWVTLRHHYRSSIDMNDQLFRDNLNSLREFYLNLDPAIVVASLDRPDLSNSAVEDLVAKFESEMNNDFNTPGALVILSQSLRKVAELRKTDRLQDATSLQETIVYLGRILGIFQDYSLNKLTAEMLKFQQAVLHSPDLLNSDDVNNLIQKRNEARNRKDFAESDHIRNQLSLHGVSIMDSSSGTAWEFTAN